MNAISPAIPLAAYALISCLHLWCCISDKQRARHITKVLLLPLLALSYLRLSSAPQPSVLLAFLFGWLGDIFLIYPNQELPRSLGIGAFVLGHVFYIFTLLRRLSGTGIPQLVWIAPLLFLLYAAFLFSRVYRVLPGVMKILSACYFLILALIGSLGGICLFNRIPAAIWLVCGAVFFLCSDAILCRQFYTVRDPAPKTDFAVMLTYILAQLFLMLGFAL